MFQRLFRRRPAWLEPLFYVALGLGLYLSGWHTELLGRAQQGLLSTGLWQPKLPEPAIAPLSTYPSADYSLLLLPLNNPGPAVPFSALRGKVIVLNIWASWCPPCIAEMPSLARLAGRTNPDSVAFVLLSLDQNPEKARRFLARRGITVPAYSPGLPLPAAYQTGGIPATFLISPAGQIIGSHEGMAEYDTPEMLGLLHRWQNQKQ
ncbi:TlpA family protein disulfide reductase [Hymenobacter taeanensis]|uniref:TlpA family protein disulfide reductase n=1 Tax=Hymenobacter taeanensis TaxID=2735321 RepID=A0A6M6BL10_9BACT|nr:MULTISPECIES: TlpA disulfide reductase family protein [Hymenobacter]QJX48650.1 TlpA family protein disulfide reductase [Hymenobacter taeanensis]UOQ81851.1 TlpA family protein disulfide reductase [Hymenobacter sp. 5414T-23]